MVQKLANKANKFFVIEFPPKASKYGHQENAYFTDNDEASICNYAFNWLKDISFDGNIKYLGKNEMGKSEARYVFLVKKYDK